MGREVAKATQNFFEKYGQAATQRNIVGDLLLFTKFGEWVHGRDRAKLPMDTSLAAYMHTLAVGWVCWQDGKFIDEQMGLVCEGFVPPKRNELGHLDQTKWDHFDDGKPKDPWSFTNKLVLVDLETGAFFTFSTRSQGGLLAIAELCNEHGKHIHLKPDEVPIIELDVRSRQHSDRSIGEVREPVLKIVGWIPKDTLPLLNGTPTGDDDTGSEPALALPKPPEAAPKPAVAKPAKAAARYKI
jgi:hypothetical protein